MGKITEIALPEKERFELTEAKFEKEVFHPTGKVEILLCFDNYKLKAKKGLDQLPPVSAKVYLCSDEFLGSLLTEFGVKDGLKPITIPLASLPDNENHKINVSSQALFGRHCAVVGTTGGGKSWTIAKLIEQVVEQNGKAILIDATGEYETLSNGNKKIKYLSFIDGTNPTYFDYKSMRESDLIAMFRPAGQVQLPKFQDAIRSLRLRELILSDTSLTKDEPIIKEILSYTDITSGGSNKCFSKQHRERSTFSLAFEKYPEVNNEDCRFDINHLNRQINLECVYEYPFSNEMNNISLITGKKPTIRDFGNINDRDLGNCHSLIARIKSLLLNKNFSKTLGFRKMGSPFLEITSEFENFFDDKSEENILIISVEKVSTEGNLREILVNAIGRYLLESALNKKFKDNSKKSLLLFLDEAHLFLNKRIKDEYSIEVELDSFDRIAKECRKFGLFLVISTQMPRDIPRGVLSQMGTFIVHRLINQQDREAIEFACSDANKSALSFLPILSSGEAMLTGVDFPMPMILKITEPNIKPDSNTPSVF
ncbi:ATP-binding protein [Flavobacterium sp. LS1P3]|uniref:ATP-binding protein n=1 Tax=Flavobacterium sp. LS1P3 TaxID=3401720 RepID=UPI003AAE2C17